MSKIRTHLTIMVEIEENTAGEPAVLAKHEERLFAEINRNLLWMPGVQKTSLVKAQIYFQDPDCPGITLQACPFCGQFAPVHTEDCTMDPCDGAECEFCEERAYRVICDPDRGGCGVATIWTDDRADAVEDWNTRTEPGVECHG